MRSLARVLRDGVWGLRILRCSTGGQARTKGKGSTVRLPDHVSVSAGAVSAIAQRHGLGDVVLSRLADTGVINGVYLLGDEPWYFESPAITRLTSGRRAPRRLPSRPPGRPAFVRLR